MKIIAVIGAIAASILFFLGLIFLLAASVQQTITRLATGFTFILVGGVIAYFVYLSARKPVTMVQRLELSGNVSAAQIKCPNCSATVDSNRIRIVSGVPYATCPYCGTTFEIVEEPKW
jgi:DNA-directed RNA polymerase subunit RPC12/RpoP